MERPPTLHPNATKHMSADEVMQAWDAVVKSVRRETDDEPPRWLMVGWLANGESIELVAVETVDGWLVIHANSPVQKKFAQEIERAERRSRR